MALALGSPPLWALRDPCVQHRCLIWPVWCMHAPCNPLRVLDAVRYGAGYVEQFDTMLPELSVREMLLYTAELKCGRLRP